MTVATASTSTPYTAPSSPSPMAPQVLLLGLRRSGKSSLIQVLCNHLPPNDTLFLESTLKPYAAKVDLWGTCHIWDGVSVASILQTAGKNQQVTTAVPTLSWSGIATIIWVLDAQDDYFSSLASLHSLIVLAYAHNPAIHFHVFLHKMDGLSEDYRDDTQTDIEKRIDDNLSDASSTFAFAQGVHEGAKSKFIADQQADQAAAKIDWDALERRGDAGETPTTTTQPPQPLSTSSSSAAPPPPNLETDVRLTIHQTSIFDSSIFVAFSRVLQPIIFSQPNMKATLIRLVDSLVEVCAFDKLFLVHLPTRTYLVNDSSPFDGSSFDIVCDYLGFLVDFSSLFANLKSGEEGTADASTTTTPTPTPTHSSSTLRLNAESTIAFWQIDASLATIAILRSSSYDRNAALIDNNLSVFRRATSALLSTHRQKAFDRTHLMA